MKIQKGRFLFRTTYHRAGFVKNEEFKVTPGERLYIDHGDDDGVTMIEPGGRSRMGEMYACSKRSLLRTQEGAFSYEEGAPHIDRIPLTNGPPGPNDARPMQTLDVRSIGLLPRCLLDLTPEEALFAWVQDPRFTPPRDWRMRNRDGVIEVRYTRKFEYAGRQYENFDTWVLDPTRDLNPIRVTSRDQGKDICEARSTLERFGDEWFPRKVEYFHSGKPFLTKELVEASINSSSDADTLTPSDMPGVFAGTAVVAMNRPTQYWDGARVVSEEEFAARMKVGEPALKAGYAKMLADTANLREYPSWYGAADFDIPGVRDRPDLWEVYVRRFCLRHKVSQAQRTAAYAILKDCRGEAAPHARAIERWSRRSGRPLPPTSAPARVNSQPSEISQARAAIEDVFRSRLQPRLQDLLDQAQTLGGSSATTQSAAGQSPNGRP